MEPVHLDVEEWTGRLADVKPEFLTKPSLSSTSSPRDLHSGRPSCRDPDLSGGPEASAVHPLSPSPAGGPPAGRLLRGPGTSASYTRVSEVRSNGRLLLSSELEKSSSKEMDAEDPQALGVDPRHGHQMAAPKGHTSALDVTHPPSSHDHESTAASPAPVYTLVNSVSGRNSLVLTPNATPGLQPMSPKTVPTPTGYLTPDLLGTMGHQ